MVVTSEGFRCSIGMSEVAREKQTHELGPTLGYLGSGPGGVGRIHSVRRCRDSFQYELVTVGPQDESLCTYHL